MVGAEDTQGNEHHGNKSRHHTDRETSDSVGGWTGLGHLTDVRDGLGLDTHHGFNARVVFGHKTDSDTDDASEHHRVHDAHFNIDEPLVDGGVATEPEQNGTNEGGVAKCNSGVLTVLEEGHGEDTDDGGDVADKAEENGHHHVVNVPAL